MDVVCMFYVNQLGLSLIQIYNSVTNFKDLKYDKSMLQIFIYKKKVTNIRLKLQDKENMTDVLTDYQHHQRFTNLFSVFTLEVGTILKHVK